MELTGEKILSTSRARVYDALHDLATMRQAIPGCQSLTRIDRSRYQIDIALKIGPISTTFLAYLSLYNEEPPTGYSMRGFADAGGAIGGGSGEAHIALAAIDKTTTNLAYHITGTPTGRIAELPEDLLNAKLHTLTAEFFSRLQLLLENEYTPLIRSALDRVERQRAAAAAAAADVLPDVEGEDSEATPAFKVAAARIPIVEMPIAERMTSQEREAPAAKPATEASKPAPAGPVAADAVSRGASGRSDPAPQTERAEAVAETPAGPTPSATEAPRQPAQPAAAAPSPPRTFAPITEWRPTQEVAPALAAGDKMRSVTRWLFVLAGVVFIALLLSDGF